MFNEIFVSVVLHYLNKEWVLLIYRLLLRLVLICHCQLVNLLTLIFLFLCVFVANAILVHNKEGKRSASIMKNILDNP